MDERMNAAKVAMELKAAAETDGPRAGGRKIKLDGESDHIA
jgi:hypothetical protein